MAILMSEDNECPSFAELIAGDIQAHSFENQKQEWQAVRFALLSGKRGVLLNFPDGALICRSPKDEIKNLLALLQDLLSGKKEQISFEPAEPCFELCMERTPKGGIKVQAWIDSSAGIDEIYRWDAAGIRFYTTDELLRIFALELAKEFSLQS